MIDRQRLLEIKRIVCFYTKSRWTGLIFDHVRRRECRCSLIM